MVWACLLGDTESPADASSRRRPLSPDAAEESGNLFRRGAGPSSYSFGFGLIASLDRAIPQGFVGKPLARLYSLSSKAWSYKHNTAEQLTAPNLHSGSSFAGVTTAGPKAFQNTTVRQYSLIFETKLINAEGALPQL